MFLRTSVVSEVPQIEEIMATMIQLTKADLSYDY